MLLVMKKYILPNALVRQRKEKAKRENDKPAERMARVKREQK